MSDDRTEQARAEAERRQTAKHWRMWEDEGEQLGHSWSMGFMAGFREGAEWADAHPESTPEDLVTAYEEGQRDAVSKGMAHPRPHTITRAEFLEALDAHVGLGASGDWVTVEDMLIAAFMRVGIEVEQ